MVSVGILGPLTVTVDGRDVTPSAARLRTVLAVLALSAGAPVSAGRLAAAVWDEDLPASTRRTLTVYLTRLRRLLGAASIHTGPAGYTLAVDPDRVDALRFTRLLDEAARAGDARTERKILGVALDLWRGPALADTPSAWLADVEATRLTDLRLSALDRRITLDLAEHHHDGLSAELRALTARHPLRETFWAHLITALHRTGRRAEALAAYQRLYRLLADELGIEPGPEAQAAHRRVLAAAPGRSRRRPAPHWPACPSPAPHRRNAAAPARG